MMSFRNPNRLGRRMLEKEERGEKAWKEKYRLGAIAHHRRQRRAEIVAHNQGVAHQNALDRGSKLAWMKEPAEKRPWYQPK